MARSIIENTVVAYLDNDDSPDITNPIHSTEVAQSYGFNGPLVGGVTVWGWATDTILAALGVGWLEDGWAEYSFRHPTFPGDSLKVKAALNEDSPDATWTVEMINQSNEICVSGKVGLGKAEWLPELIRPRSMGPTDGLGSKGPLTLENAETGKDWSAMELDFSEEASTEFIAQKQRQERHCSSFMDGRVGREAPPVQFRYPKFHAHQKSSAAPPQDTSRHLGYRWRPPDRCL